MKIMYQTPTETENNGNHGNENYGNNGNHGHGDKDDHGDHR